jgi:hypothetical protein
MYEGELYNSNGKPIIVYLFNDILIVCKDKNDRQHTEADERRANRKRILFAEYHHMEADVMVADVK